MARTLEIHNPATRELVGTLPVTDADGLTEMAAAAKKSAAAPAKPAGKAAPKAAAPAKAAAKPAKKGK